MIPSYFLDQGGYDYHALAAIYAGQGADIEYDDDNVPIRITPRERVQTCTRCSDAEMTVRWHGRDDEPCWNCGVAPADALTKSG